MEHGSKAKRKRKGLCGYSNRNGSLCSHKVVKRGVKKFRSGLCEDHLIMK